jgi:N-hydroxyarylamine O-acetyltransferase
LPDAIIGGDAMSEDVKLTAYFERIGFAGSIAPTLATLEALHALQPAAIPFENLDSFAGRKVALDSLSLDRKLIDERRGGYCFELNLLFQRVLNELGFVTQGHLAETLWGHLNDQPFAPDHSAITVELAGTTYLADVGFGGLTQMAPLQLEPVLEQETRLGTYRLIAEGPYLRLEHRRETGWWPAYRLSLEPAGADAYARLSDALNANPDWFLRQHLLVERLSEAGRTLLYDTRLTTPGAAGPEERTLGSGAEIREVLSTAFGIQPGPLDGLDALLARLVTNNVMTS